MDEKEMGADEGASESALAIADAIYAGLTEIARAVDRFAAAFSDDGEPEQRIGQYLDGTRIE